LRASGSIRSIGTRTYIEREVDEDLVIIGLVNEGAEALAVSTPQSQNHNAIFDQQIALTCLQYALILVLVLGWC